MQVRIDIFQRLFQRLIVGLYFWLFVYVIRKLQLFFPHADRFACKLLHIFKADLIPGFGFDQLIAFIGLPQVRILWLLNIIGLKTRKLCNHLVQLLLIISCRYFQIHLFFAFAPGNPAIMILQLQNITDLRTRHIRIVNIRPDNLIFVPVTGLNVKNIICHFLRDFIFCFFYRHFINRNTI